MSESPKDHLKSHQFEPYRKVRGFILTLENYKRNGQYRIFDRSCLLNETFKSKTPDLNLTSISPLSPLSKEMNHKMKLVKAYHNLTKLRKRSKEDYKILKEGRVKSPNFRQFTPTKYNHSITKLVNTPSYKGKGMFLTENMAANTPKVQKKKNLFTKGSEKRYFRVKDQFSLERNLDLYHKPLKKLEFSFENQQSLNRSYGLYGNKYPADSVQSLIKQGIRKKELIKSMKVHKS